MSQPLLNKAHLIVESQMSKQYFLRFLYPAAMLVLTGMPPMTISAFAGVVCAAEPAREYSKRGARRCRWLP